MKSLKILFIFFFIINCCYGQNGFTNKKEAKNKIDANGWKQGKWIEYTDSYGKISTQDRADGYKLTIYKDDKEAETVYRFRYPSGILSAEQPINNGKLNGVSKYYSESGKIRSEVPNTDDKRNGISRYFYESGLIQSEEPYTNGKLNGVLKKYDENGKLTSETSYIDGKKIQTADGEQDAIARYQLAMDQYDNKEYGKAIDNLNKIAELDSTARIKTSYILAKCLETFLYQTSTLGQTYDACLKSINYYIKNGKDEEKKTELRKMKISIEDSEDYKKKAKK